MEVNINNKNNKNKTEILCSLLNAVDASNPV